MMWARDLWRGWSDSDLVSARARLSDRKAGEAIRLTRREFRALLSRECLVGYEPFGTREIGIEHVFDRATMKVWKRPRMGAFTT